MKAVTTFFLFFLTYTLVSAQYEEMYSHLNQANELHKKADYKEAIVEYDKVIQMDPGNIVAYFNRASSKANLGLKKEAIADYAKAIELDPEYTKAYYNRAQLEYQFEWYDEAINDFDMVIKQNPDFQVAYYNRGLAKYYAKNKAGACADWTKANEMGYKKAAGKLKQICSDK